MNTLPPPPNDIPDSFRSKPNTIPNNLDGPTINLAALPPPDEPQPLPYFDGDEGTCLDQEEPEEDRSKTLNYSIPHPNQYLLPLPGAEDCSCSELKELQEEPKEQEHNAPIALRNRYKDKTKSKPKITFAQDKDDEGEDHAENSSLLLTNPTSLASTTSTRDRKAESKIPRRQNNSQNSNKSKHSHNVTQV